MSSAPKIRQPKAAEIKGLHPEGIFGCRILDIGEARPAKASSAPGIFIMTVTLLTTEGQIFASIAGYLHVLGAVLAAKEFYKSKGWQVKVHHRKIDDKIYAGADILWERGGADV